MTKDSEKKVLSLLEKEGVLYGAYDYKVCETTEPLDEEGNFTETAITVAMSNGTQVWAVHQYRGNEQSIGTFLLEGGMIVANVPYEVMEVANVLRSLNAYEHLDEVWDEIEGMTK